jgi:hypothetical protein
MHAEGLRRLWAIISVVAGLYVMFYLSDAFMHPMDTLNALYDNEMARLEETLKQVNTGTGSEQAIKQAEEAIAGSKSGYIKLVQDIPKVAMGSFFVALIASFAAGVGVYVAGMAVGWVYRGFRPLPVSPTVEAPPLAPNMPQTTAPALEQLPALPHPDNKQS